MRCSETGGRASLGSGGILGLTMATGPYIPVEMYLQGEFEPDAEYVDGVIEERPMGEYDHATWQQALLLWFGTHEGEWGIRVRPELRIQVGASRYRVPDVAVLDASLPKEQIITHPPIAVFEIVSPEDRMSRLDEKLSDYQAMGIRNIVVIDPARDAVWVYRGGSLMRELPEQLVGSACTVDWVQIREFLR